MFQREVDYVTCSQHFSKRGRAEKEKSLEHKYFKDDLVFPKIYLFCSVLNEHTELFELKNINLSRKDFNEHLSSVVLFILTCLYS